MLRSRGQGWNKVLFLPVVHRLAPGDVTGKDRPGKYIRKHFVSGADIHSAVALLERKRTNWP